MSSKFVVNKLLPIQTNKNEQSLSTKKQASFHKYSNLADREKICRLQSRSQNENRLVPSRNVNQKNIAAATPECRNHRTIKELTSIPKVLSYESYKQTNLRSDRIYANNDRQSNNVINDVNTLKDRSNQVCKVVNQDGVNKIQASPNYVFNNFQAVNVLDNDLCENMLVLQRKCDELKKNIMRHQLRRGHVAGRFPEYSCTKEAMGDNKENQLDVLDKDNLNVFAKQFNELLFQSNTCKKCNQLPADLKGTLEGVNKLIDLVHIHGKKSNLSTLKLQPRSEPKSKPRITRSTTKITIKLSQMNVGVQSSDCRVTMDHETEAMASTDMKISTSDLVQRRSQKIGHPPVQLFDKAEEAKVLSKTRTCGSRKASSQIDKETSPKLMEEDWITIEERQEPQYDKTEFEDANVDAVVEVYEEVGKDYNIRSTVTKSGAVEVTTKSLESVIETSLTYTKSGNVNISTEVITFKEDPNELKIAVSSTSHRNSSLPQLLAKSSLMSKKSSPTCALPHESSNEVSYSMVTTTEISFGGECTSFTMENQLNSDENAAIILRESENKKPEVVDENIKDTHVDTSESPVIPETGEISEPQTAKYAEKPPVNVEELLINATQNLPDKVEHESAEINQEEETKLLPIARITSMDALIDGFVLETKTKETPGERKLDELKTQSCISVDEKPFDFEDLPKCHLRDKVEEALSKANFDVMDALQQANKNVAKALQNVHSNVASALSLAIGASEDKQSIIEEDLLQTRTILTSVPRHFELTQSLEDVGKVMQKQGVGEVKQLLEVVGDETQREENVESIYVDDKQWQGREKSPSTGRRYWGGEYSKEKLKDIPRIPIFIAPVGRPPKDDCLCHDVCGRLYRQHKQVVNDVPLLNETAKEEVTENQNNDVHRTFENNLIVEDKSNDNAPEELVSESTLRETSVVVAATEADETESVSITVEGVEPVESVVISSIVDKVPDDLASLTLPRKETLPIPIILEETTLLTSPIEETVPVSTIVGDIISENMAPLTLSIEAIPFAKASSDEVPAILNAEDTKETWSKSSVLQEILEETPVLPSCTEETALVSICVKDISEAMRPSNLPIEALTEKIQLLLPAAKETISKSMVVEEMSQESPHLTSSVEKTASISIIIKDMTKEMSPLTVPIKEILPETVSTEEILFPTTKETLPLTITVEEMPFMTVSTEKTALISITVEDTSKELPRLTLSIEDIPISTVPTEETSPPSLCSTGRATTTSSSRKKQCQSQKSRRSGRFKSDVRANQHSTKLPVAVKVLCAAKSSRTSSDSKHLQELKPPQVPQEDIQIVNQKQSQDVCRPAVTLEQVSCRRRSKSSSHKKEDSRSSRQPSRKSSLKVTIAEAEKGKSKSVEQVPSLLLSKSPRLTEMNKCDCKRNDCKKGSPENLGTIEDISKTDRLLPEAVQNSSIDLSKLLKRDEDRRSFPGVECLYKKPCGKGNALDVLDTKTSTIISNVLSTSQAPTESASTKLSIIEIPTDTQIVSTTGTSHPPDCDCFSCLLTKSSATTSSKHTRTGVHSDISRCREGLDQIRQPVEEKQTNESKLEKTLLSLDDEFQQQMKKMADFKEMVKKTGSVCHQAQMKAATGSPLEKSFVAIQSSSYHLTLSGLNAALATLQSKSNTQDQMVATLTNELKLQTNHDDDLIQELKIQDNERNRDEDPEEDQPCRTTSSSNNISTQDNILQNGTSQNHARLDNFNCSRLIDASTSLTGSSEERLIYSTNVLEDNLAAKAAFVIVPSNLKSSHQSQSHAVDAMLKCKRVPRSFSPNSLHSQRKVKKTVSQLSQLEEMERHLTKLPRQCVPCQKRSSIRNYLSEYRKPPPFKPIGRCPKPCVCDTRLKPFSSREPIMYNQSNSLFSQNKSCTNSKIPKQQLQCNKRITNLTYPKQINKTQHWLCEEPKNSIIFQQPIVNNELSTSLPHTKLRFRKSQDWKNTRGFPKCFGLPSAKESDKLYENGVQKKNGVINTHWKVNSATGSKPSTTGNRSQCPKHVSSFPQSRFITNHLHK